MKDPGLPDVFTRTSWFAIDALDMFFVVHWETLHDHYDKEHEAIADTMLARIAIAYASEGHPSESSHGDDA